jgi:hypothetical protein
LKFAIPRLAQKFGKGNISSIKPRHKATIKAKQGDINKAK